MCDRRFQVGICILGALLTISYGSVAGAVQTTNYIPKFTATPPTVDDSVIYQSTTKIGIGTTSPLNTLHVNSGTANNVVLFESTDPGAVILLKDNLTTASEAIGRGGDDLDLRTNFTPRLTVKGGTGWVGIGTTAPMALLDVSGSMNIKDGNGAGVITFGASGAYPNLYIRSDDNPGTYEPQSERVFIGGNGKVGIGTTAPAHRLTVDADTTGTWATDPGNAQLALRGATDTTLELALGVDTTNGKARIQAADLWVSAIDLLLQPAGGNVGIGTTAPTKKLTVRGNILVERSNGTAVMELGDGLDYAEGFDVAGADKPQPGTVLVIDSSSPGKLTVSAKAYDTTVAGIVAGANNLESGVRLGVGDFDCDVSLAGRVYCNVDATEYGVQAGDLLTTSNTSGYAMKAADRMQTPGAVLGKAMQSLEKGQKGQILVLVTLQ